MKRALLIVAVFVFGVVSGCYLTSRASRAEVAHNRAEIESGRTELQKVKAELEAQKNLTELATATVRMGNKQLEECENALHRANLRLQGHR
jgi:hypothetical protein